MIMCGFSEKHMTYKNSMRGGLRTLVAPRSATRRHALLFVLATHTSVEEGGGMAGGKEALTGQLKRWGN